MWEYGHSERDVYKILTEKGFTTELIEERKTGNRIYRNIYAKFVGKAGE